MLNRNLLGKNSNNKVSILNVNIFYLSSRDMPAPPPGDDNRQARLGCAFQNLDMDEKEREVLLRYKTKVSPDERNKYPWAMPEAIRDFQAAHRRDESDAYMNNGVANRLILDVLSKLKLN